MRLPILVSIVSVLAFGAGCSGDGPGKGIAGTGGTGGSAGSTGGSAGLGGAGQGGGGAGGADAGGDGPQSSADLGSPDQGSPTDAPADVSMTTPDLAADTAPAPTDVAPDATAPVDTAPDAVAMCGKISCDCTFKGKDLRGGMAYTDNFPYDFSVFVTTNNLPDLYVQDVPRPGLTTRCGQWQPDAFVPSFRVRKVLSLAQADFTIQYVTPPTLPGIPGMRF